MKHKMNFFRKVGKITYYWEQDPKKTASELLKILHTKVMCQFCKKMTPQKKVSAASVAWRRAV